MSQIKNKFLSQMATLTLKGNNTGITANPLDLTVAQVKTMLNLAGTNSGDVTLTAVGSTPNANGASLSTQVLTLQPADGTNPGVVTAVAQTLAGVKTFSSAPNLSSLTASQALVLDGSKNITTLAYASTNTATTLVERDGSGNFAAGTITAALTGTASGNTTYSANNHGVVLSSATNAMVVIAPNASTAFPLISGGTGADPTWAALSIAGGGTGQVTKAAAFDALSPMTTGGDLIYGGASGTGTRLANGSAGQVLQSNGTTTAPSWASLILSASDELLNLGLSVTASAGTMTIALKDNTGSDASATSPVKVGFRNATAATGTYTEVSVTAALSMTLAGATTLGGASGVAYYVYVYLVNNAGTLTLAASLINVDEGTLQSTSTTTTSNQVLYQASALSTKPIRLIGRFLATNTTSSWASPTEVSVNPFIKNSIVARYTSAAGQSIGTGAGNVIVNFDTKAYDSHNAVTTGASWAFTAPQAGKYLVVAFIRYASAAFTLAQTVDLTIFVNGSNMGELDEYTIPVAATTTIPLQGTATISMAAGDTFNIRTSQPEATNRSLTASANFVYMSVYYEGN